MKKRIALMLAQTAIRIRQATAQSDKTPHAISGDAVSKAQCLACGEDRFYTKGKYCMSTEWCNNSNEFPNDSGNCIECFQDEKSYSITNGPVEPLIYSNYFNEQCNVCTNRKARKFWNGNMYCVIDCQQPKNAPVKCEDPVNCDRIWQNTSSQCLKCDDTKNSSAIYTQDEEARSLCEACGREVVEVDATNSYCIYPQKCSESGEFRGKDGKCYQCRNTKGIDVNPDDVSCVENCKNTETLRWKGQDRSGKWKCFPLCTDGKIQKSDGFCRSCDGYDVFTPLNESDCEGICKERRRLYMLGTSPYCAPSQCDTDDDYYQNQSGNCFSCTSDIAGILGRKEIAIESCLSCHNRIVYDNYYCYLVNPGIIGICSSLDAPLPQQLRSDLKDKAQPYIDGDYDGKLFRGTDGYCYECSDQNISPSQQQLLNVILAEIGE